MELLIAILFPWQISVEVNYLIPDYAMEGLVCFCRPSPHESGVKADAFPVVAVDEATDGVELSMLECGDFPYIGAGQYECGALLKSDEATLM